MPHGGRCARRRCAWCSTRTIAEGPGRSTRACSSGWPTLSEKLGGNETIGTTENLLEGVEPAVRGRETALGNLLTDVAREQMRTDVAVLNGGSIRINDNIPPGPITKYDMEGIFYYTNTLVAVPRDRRSSSWTCCATPSRASTPATAASCRSPGCRFTYRPRDGEFIVDAGGRGGRRQAARRERDLQPSPPIDYLYQHGTDDGYTLFADATRPPKMNTEREADFRTTVEEYIREQGTVTTEIEGRIVRTWSVSGREIALSCRR